MNSQTDFLLARVKKDSHRLNPLRAYGGLTMFNTKYIAYIRQEGLGSVIGLKRPDSSEVEEIETDETILYLQAQITGLNTFMDRLLFLLGGGKSK